MSLESTRIQRGKESAQAPLVIYHANCIDGFTAAWIAHKALVDAELYPAKYGSRPPVDLITGRDVYILDFSYPKEDLIGIRYYASSLRVLDHHKSAEKDCKDLDFCTFDMEKSGCRLAWEYFQGPEDCPQWIKRIEDRDLWRFHYQDTRRVHAYISSWPMSLHNWGSLSKTSLRDMVIVGAHLVRATNVSIAKNIEEAQLKTLKTESGVHKVIVLNVPYEHRSETGHHLLGVYSEADYSMTYFRCVDGRWQYDLRSRKKDNIDVSVIAEGYGGGGHANAAGFMSRELIEELK